MEPRRRDLARGHETVTVVPLFPKLTCNTKEDLKKKQTYVPELTKRYHLQSLIAVGQVSRQTLWKHLLPQALEVSGFLVSCT